VNNDLFVIQYLPICLGDNVRAWLEFLPADSIGGWADLRKMFVENFQGTYVRPGNSWDLKSCKQERGESLRDYICRFSKQCNSLPDIVNADVISAFLIGTSCKTLVHKLGCQKPRTTRELLDIATNHASGEEAIGAVFVQDQPVARAKKEGPAKSPANHDARRNKRKRRPLQGHEVAAAEQPQ